MNLRRFKPKSGGFTLVELLIVVVVLTILAAVVLPQFNNTTSEAKVGALDANLSALRSAIDLYHAQHGHYPGSVAATGGTGPSGSTAGTGAADSVDALKSHLTMYTNVAGQALSATDNNFKYGPYLKGAFPKEPISGSDAIVISTTGGLTLTADSGSPGGWKYDVKTGRIIANTVAHQAR